MFPKSDVRFEGLICEYDNLLYACNHCNTAKGTEILLDPTQARMSDHLLIDQNGYVQGLTSDGKLMVIILALNAPRKVQTRLYYIRLADLFRKKSDDLEVQKLYRHSFGYPDDLPDLESMRPTGNHRPTGLKVAHLVRATSNELAEVYLG